ncbi:MAG: YhgE/Pip family protein [Propionibacteriaceae bacterium]|jgi:putative membrane protein|nr:YhgE/Pip family protein [Propionibacteriaceae bacterium]
MNIWQICWAGVKSNFTSVVRVITLICIAIVPVLYPLFYLQAFWDPYGNLEHLPVAMVNLDTGSGSVNLGANLVTSLQDSHDIEWHFVDLETADSGLVDMTYYAEFVIPSDFSTTLEAVKDGHPQTAHIELRTNSKNSFMSSLLAQQVETRLQTKLSQQVATTYLTAMLDSLAQGSGKLAAGAGLADPTGKSPLTQGTQAFAAQVEALSQAGIADFVANPIDAVVTDTNPVPNYGTGFAPYFLSLSGWIGALLITLTIGSRLRRVPTKAGPVRTVIGRYLACAVVGAIQSVLMVGVIALVGIEPKSWAGLLGVLLASSFASVAIVSTLVALLGRLGQLFAMIILVFQLTGCGGTFPTPLTNGTFFTDIHPYVSFTYSIRALREVISAQTINVGGVWKAVGFLAVYIVASLVINVALYPLLNRVKKRVMSRSEESADGSVGEANTKMQTQGEPAEVLAADMAVPVGAGTN